MQDEFNLGLKLASVLDGRFRPELPRTYTIERQALATGFTIGMRFHSAPVVRVADAKPMELGHAARADGAWRLYVFADAERVRLTGLLDFLAHSPQSPICGFTPAAADWSWSGLPSTSHMCYR